ncbi:MAG: hypothetical protein ACLP8S_29065 [Solirubrobacteraceae bacterium]
MPTVLIQLPEGQGVIQRDDGTIVITHEINDDHGQPLRGRDDYRPLQTGLDEARSIVAGLLPPRAVSAEIIDDRGTRVAATTGNGVYATILQQPNDGRGPIVCSRDENGAPVPRPLPADWTRTHVTDAEEPCPACGAIDYDEVLPTDGSRGGRGGHGHDGPLEPCRIVVCRRCGHEEGAGTSLFAYISPDDEDETAKAARIARHRAEARVQKWYSDTMTLRGVTFPIYATETWLARITGSGSSGNDLTKITIGHYAEETDDPFRRPDLTVTTAINQRHNSELRRTQRALEAWVHDDHNRPLPDGLSDAATMLWFAARRRDRHAAALEATPAEQLITIDGTPQPFLTLSTPTGRWVAVRRHDNLTITIAARDIEPATLTLEPIPDPAARLLGPEPPDPTA